MKRCCLIKISENKFWSLTGKLNQIYYFFYKKKGGKKKKVWKIEFGWQAREMATSGSKLCQRVKYNCYIQLSKLNIKTNTHQKSEIMWIAYSNSTFLIRWSFLDQCEIIERERFGCKFKCKVINERLRNEIKFTAKRKKFKFERNIYPSGE